MDVKTGSNNITSNDQWVQGAARVGYLSRGAVYLIVGIFAFSAAKGGGDAVGTKGALSLLLQQTLGATMVTLTAIGLVCYSCWRVIQASKDTDHHGTDFKGLGIRTVLYFSALVHLSLVYWCYQLLTRLGDSSSDQSWSEWLLNQPYGQYVILGIAASVSVAAFAHIRKGLQSNFLQHFKERPSKTLVAVCQIGLIAKGVAYLVIGYLFFETYLTGSSEGKKGIATALSTIQQQYYGGFLLGCMGFGLVAFAIYSILEAFYRKV